MTGTSLDLQRFYPDELVITSIDDEVDRILIHLKSCSKEMECPQCHRITEKYHGMYHRTVQDLPIFGKSVWLDIDAHEYFCENSDCPVTSTVETFHGFLGFRKRMTERCAALVCALALETSCEACAMICREMGIQISGDTVIRMLLDLADRKPAPICGDSIGIDDFAYRKGNTYCTVIVNEEDRAILDILDGRDGSGLREWLRNNQHIRIVTRDRSGAYAKAISEMLPQAMQIADRFHLHQNLLSCIKNILQSTLPATMKVPKTQNLDRSTNMIISSKKKSG